MNKKGFTLIELLIVIAVIGVMAAALFVVIDPLEQMAKTRDGGAISRAKEVVGAAERYYLTMNAEPNPFTCAALITARELKTRGCEGPTAAGAGITLAGAAGTYTASFFPTSKAYATKCGGGALGVETCIVPTEF